MQATLDRYPYVYMKAADGRAPVWALAAWLASRRGSIDSIDTAPPFTADDVARLNARYAGVGTADMLADLLGGRSSRAASRPYRRSAANRRCCSIWSPRSTRTCRSSSSTPRRSSAKRWPIATTLAEQLGFTDLRVFRPDPRLLADKDATSLRWSYDPDGCCDLRKVEPLRRALAPFDAWISGRKGFQGKTRTALPRFELDEGRLKINPLADWDKAALDAAFEARKLPRHPLEAQGYPSVGCVPCTSAGAARRRPARRPLARLGQDRVRDARPGLLSGNKGLRRLGPEAPDPN